MFCIKMSLMRIWETIIFATRITVLDSSFLESQLRTEMFNSSFQNSGQLPMAIKLMRPYSGARVADGQLQTVSLQ